MESYDVKIRSVSKKFGSSVVLQEIDLDIKQGELLTLLGPSGCGKSTLFRILLGFENPESGAVYYDAHDLAGLDIQAVRRQIGVCARTGGEMRWWPCYAAIS